MEPDDLNTRALPRGALLWHYTSFEGLEGILAGKLWASSLRYLNDTEEFDHGLNIALEVLQNELAIALSQHGHPDGAAIANIIHSQVVEFFSERYQPRDVFVAAFSAKQDDLSQWRAYGATGGPQFSIGFHPAVLEQTADDYLFILQEVKYERRNIIPDLRLALRPSIDDILEGLTEQPSAAPARCRQWAQDIAGTLMLLAPFYKHPKFEDEQEWRLVCRQAAEPPFMLDDPLPMHFRRSGSLIVPYIEMPLRAPAAKAEDALNTSPVVTITIGPSPHPEHLRYAVREMTSRWGGFCVS